ncbi:MAG: hypothetical protein EHM89_03015, partial [Acidobacteria bacterium]
MRQQGGMTPSAKLMAAAALLVMLVAVFAIVPTRAAILSQLWGLNQVYFAEFQRKLAARTAPDLDEPLFKAASVAEAPVPTAKYGGGRYDGPISVSLDSKDAITYTLDGSIPTRQSAVYRDPLPINTTTALRFRAFRDGLHPSPVVTHTYVIALDTKLPVVSVVMDPVDLWNRYTGIYDNPEEKGSEWQRAAHIEHLPVQGSGDVIQFPAEIRIHGQTSRSRPKKSFRFTYESKLIEPQSATSLWHPRPGEPTRTVVLRTGGAYRLRNELFQTLFAEVGGIGSPATLYLMLLNGEVWGLYNIHEYIDESFLVRHVAPGQYDLIPDGGDGAAVAGDKKAWKEFETFYKTHDASREGDFRRFGELIDLDNFTDYWLFNVYAANFDWPHHNTLAFRDRTGADRRWRWISWDVDAAFDFDRQGLRHDTAAWALRNELRHDLRFNHHKGLQDQEEFVAGTLLMRQLVKNAAFRERLASRMCHLLETTLRPSHAEGVLNNLVRETGSGLPLDLTRWSIAPKAYWDEVGAIRRFVRERPDLVRSYLGRAFGLPPQHCSRPHADPK